jgi:hypothetical protein
MAITQAMTTSFKAQLLLAVHDFRPTGDTGADTFKLALYTSSASLDANTTTYTSSNESTGSNYTAGGLALTNTGVGTTNSNANTTLTNASVCVLDFGADKTSTDGDFTIIFPTNDASNAIIRIA